MRSEYDARAPRFERLSRLGEYDVDRDEPDPRGWTVVNREGAAVGEVKDLVVDTSRMAATHLDVELDRKLFDIRDDDPHVLVPVERAHADGRRIVVDDISSQWVSELRAARANDLYAFWDRWWHRDEVSGAPEVRGPRIRHRVHPEDLNRMVEEVGPGESVRIPVVNEEIVVERRPVPGDERVRDEHVVVNRGDDEPPRR